ncbi:MAG: glycerol-3-phosphate 1-O-acyltransferase PlsY [Bacteroidales bacterium]|nr:glycerol-3-phosphate 1-O-acyltransferase PlsY [Bacteroidales bacterium]
MTTTLLIIIAGLLAYLTGSIPTSVWVGRGFFGIDVREHGSGNAGATNTMRVLGVKVGIPVLIFDLFKGWVAVKYASFFNIFPSGSQELMILGIVLGMLAVVGHIYPVFVEFRGGKGVATIFGVFLSLALLPTLSAAAVFLIVLLIFKYVSLGSIIAGISFPIWIDFVFDSSYLSLRIFSIIVSVLLVVTHMKNIKRLIRAEEEKASFLFKKKS